MERGVDGRKVTTSICGKIIKIVSQQKHERFDHILRKNDIFTKINFQYSNMMGSEEYRSKKGV